MTRQIIAGSARLLALTLVIAPVAANAQGNASAAAAAMGGNYTAMARNFNAIAWNPANLALPGNSLFSIALSPQLGVGSGPLTFADLIDVEGQVVSSAVREGWLQKIGDAGGQTLNGEASLTPLALSLGRLAFSATTTLRAEGTLPAGFAELIFFGNAGRTGTAEDIALEGLGLDGNVTTTFALAYGRKFALGPLPDFSIGVTGKYILGHKMASMRDNGSLLYADPLGVTIDAPVVLSDTGSFNGGSGYGLDIGAAWSFKAFRMGAVLHNAVNTFSWNTDKLYYIPVRVVFDGTTSESQGDSILPLAMASTALRDELRSRVSEAKITPTLAVGVAYTALRRLTIAADLRQRVGEGRVEVGPKTQIGVGAELRLIPLIPLRAGVTTLGDGMRMSAGFGLELGILNLQVAALLKNSGGRDETGGAFTLSIGGR